MILIAGDSWGCGCYTVQHDLYHRGIEQLARKNLSLEKFNAQREILETN